MNFSESQPDIGIMPSAFKVAFNTDWPILPSIPLIATLMSDINVSSNLYLF